jgi:hypothetical protein
MYDKLITPILSTSIKMKVLDFLVKLIFNPTLKFLELLEGFILVFFLRETVKHSLTTIYLNKRPQKSTSYICTKKQKENNKRGHETKAMNQSRPATGKHVSV